MKLFVAFSVLFACIFATSIFNNDYQERALFNNFITTFDKKYTPEEYQTKFQIFKGNLIEIERRSRLNPTVQYNVTKFADMTLQEFRKYPCGVDKLSDLDSRRPDFKPVIAEPMTLHGNVPVSWDWVAKGAVTPVKDQQQCGSCWAFSTIGNVEGVWHLAGHPLTGLSEQQEVACSTTDYGCEGGWPFWALTDMLAAPYHGRIDSEVGYPYTSGDGENGVCQFGTKDVGATIKSYKSYCTEQTPACTEPQMQELMMQYGPLSICLNATPMQFYTGGVDNPTDCDPTQIDHCVTLTGWGVDKGVPYWRIKNSWNTNWGEQGYYRLIRGTGACGMNRVITIASA